MTCVFAKAPAPVGAKASLTLTKAAGVAVTLRRSASSGFIGRRRSPQGGVTSPNRVRTGQAGCAVEFVRSSRGPGPAGQGSPQARRPRLAARAADPFSRPAGLFARIVLSEPVCPCLRAVCDSAVSGFKVGYDLRAPPAAAKLAAGLPAALTRMARPLTLARWGTDDEDGAPTEPGAMGD